MVRQRNPTLASAARLSVREPARALQLLPVIQEQDAAARHARMARDFGVLSPSDRAQTLLLTGSHEARRDINARVRAELGLAGSGEHIRVFRGLDMTAAQKKQLETYQPGLATHSRTTDRRSFYTDVTRARDTAVVVTDSALRLAQRVRSDHAKIAALEVAGSGEMGARSDRELG